jgi:hypothetical protein
MGEEVLKSVDSQVAAAVWIKSVSTTDTCSWRFPRIVIDFKQ